jgi:hypothetical protein
MRTILKRLILFVALVLTIASCKQDIGGSEWDVDVLAPVIKTTLTMADLLADSLLTADAQGGLRFKIETSLIDLPLDSILKIPDTTISKSISLGVNLNNIPPGTQLLPVTDATQYELGDLALKKVIVREGTLKLKVSSVLGTKIEFEYSIPGANKIGSVFQTAQTLEAGTSSNPSTLDLEFDLSGYSIDLTGITGTGFNTLATVFVIKTAEDGGAVDIIANQEFFNLEYSFVGILLDYGLGYFGQQSTNSENETTDLDVLNRITDGQMFLDSVTIGLSLTNPVGADARFKLDEFGSINTRTNSTVNLSHQVVGSNVLLSRAQDISGTAESVIPNEAHYELNDANSNIKQFIENLPDQLSFTFGFDLNPLGNVSAGNDFFYYDRPFQALMDIDIPLRTTLTNLTLVDTLDWNLSSLGVVESVNSGSFTLIANNAMPLEGLVELILMDENFAELDTLLVPSTIAAPPLDAGNKVISPVESRILIPIPDKTSNVLTQTKKVRIRVRFNTANQPNLIEFYDTNFIDVKLIGNFNINFGAGTF